MARVAYLYCYRKRLVAGMIILVVIMLVLMAASSSFRVWVLAQNKTITPTSARNLETLTRRALKALDSYRRKRFSRISDEFVV